MRFIAFSLIAFVAIVSSALGTFGYAKAERHLDSACICAALIWIWTGISQPCAGDPDHAAPWDRPGAHAIDWRTR